jgi:AraC family transcriptional regulator of adaptative response / DNA-3-methyladenine glycosylase II
MPKARQRTLVGLARALAEGEINLDVGCDWNLARAGLAALPGIGPWSIETIAMRGLGDPDAFTVTDLGIRKAARALGLPDTPGRLKRHSERWRPWRSYAAQYLLATTDHAVNRLPTEPAA